jgi:FkbM family methyltransferase
MLITFEDINNILFAKKIKPKGCFHVGAHHCEEFNLYLNIGIDAKDIIWIEGFPKLIEEMKERNIPDLNLIHALITDKDDEDVTLNIANNYLSSSILEFGTHTTEYPDIQFIDKIEQKSITIDTFFERNNLDASKYDFWNIDIQGAELLALKGATKSIQYAKVIYLEVHSAELYKDCALIQDVDDFLAQYNFKRVLTNMTPHKCGDAIYILND